MIWQQVQEEGIPPSPVYRSRQRPTRNRAQKQARSQEKSNAENKIRCNTCFDASAQDPKDGCYGSVLGLWGSGDETCIVVVQERGLAVWGKYQGEGWTLRSKELQDFHVSSICLDGVDQLCTVFVADWDESPFHVLSSYLCTFCDISKHCQDVVEIERGPGSIDHLLQVRRNEIVLSCTSSFQGSTVLEARKCILTPNADEIMEEVKLVPVECHGSSHALLQPEGIEDALLAVFQSCIIVWNHQTGDLVKTILVDAEKCSPTCTLKRSTWAAIEKGIIYILTCFEDVSLMAVHPQKGIVACTFSLPFPQEALTSIICGNSLYALGKIGKVEIMQDFMSTRAKCFSHNFQSTISAFFITEASLLVANNEGVQDKQEAVILLAPCD
ncbi:unnamed protein product [Darwinula stevensoni]|uniref:Uncharacterized protein n=1 Tax=Darwinula stevensoni TaxID=69355 RepID=A0A7R9A2C6_9CRUS|nr:unnamed protein product [Darwinula stevensoni]CAG0889401.1 unnamed protein product [Darwinula stevensoni]